MIVEVSVRPGARRFSLASKGGRLVAELESEPENNKANIELVSGLSKLLGKPVRLIAGHKARRKKLSVDISEAEWVEFLARLPP
ncbi:MAG: DUF167 domain-containing protein [Candidatus Micrarchaeota archaeon]